MDSDASTQTVFYSWQSDLENRTNRSFIQEALQKAIDAVLETELALDVVIDRDTQNTVGTVDVAKTILEKIEQATIFVADVSIINSKSNERLTPNPNVLFEFGYAVHALSWDNVLAVFNLATGQIEDLPFDLRSRRPVTYTMPDDAAEKKDELKKLARTLQAAIQAILKSQRNKKTHVEFVYQSVPCSRFGVKNLSLLPIEIIKFSMEYPKSIEINGYPISQPSPLIRVEDSSFEDGTATSKYTLFKTDAPMAFGYSNDWRLTPKIDSEETEIFKYPAFGFKEDASPESKIKLSISLAKGHPIKIETTLGHLRKVNKPIGSI